MFLMVKDFMSILKIGNVRSVQILILQEDSSVISVKGTGSK